MLEVLNVVIPLKKEEVRNIFFARNKTFIKANRATNKTHQSKELPPSLLQGEKTNVRNRRDEDHSHTIQQKNLFFFSLIKTFIKPNE